MADDTPYKLSIETEAQIAELQKLFYKTMLTVRKERILDKALQLLRKRDRALER